MLVFLLPIKLLRKERRNKALALFQWIQNWLSHEPATHALFATAQSTCVPFLENNNIPTQPILYIPSSFHIQKQSMSTPHNQSYKSMANPQYHPVKTLICHVTHSIPSFHTLAFTQGHEIPQC